MTIIHDNPPYSVILINIHRIRTFCISIVCDLRNIHPIYSLCINIKIAIQQVDITHG